MIDAIAGPVSPPPPDVTIPPHVNCEPGWHFVVDDGVCLMLDLQTRAWEASQANCESFGANLVSINSPKKQEEVYTLTGLDPSSTGKGTKRNLNSLLQSKNCFQNRTNLTLTLNVIVK